MLPKKYRLTKNADFSKICSKGFYGASDGIAIKYIKNDRPETHLGFPIGKNFSPKAVDRNRARRVLKAACLPYLKRLKLGFDIVVMIQKNCEALDAKKAENSLGQIFKKAKLID